MALLVAGVIAALPVLHCTVLADAALPVVSHHSAAAAVSGSVEDVGQRMGRAVANFSGQIFDVIAGKIRSGGAFRMLWAALIVPLFLSLHLVRVVAPRAPPRRRVSLAADSGRGRLQQICVSRR